VAQPHHGAQQRPLVGLGAKPRHPLVHGFARKPVEPPQIFADPVLHVRECLPVEASGEAREQFGQKARDQREHLRRRLDDEIVRPRRQDHERYEQPDDATDRDFDHALERRRDRAGMGDGGTEEHHHRGERRGAEARIERGEQNRRR
jgi:hypothetical protein